jgi:peptide/nickel transport system permease protein
MAKTIAFVPLRLIATFFAVTLLTFTMVALLPGDPVDTILGTGLRAPGIEEQIREDLNLDDPFIVRYFAWLGNSVTGDLGTSYITDQPVSDTISQRLPVTAQLAFMAVFISVLVAIPVGVLDADNRASGPTPVTSARVRSRSRSRTSSSAFLSSGCSRYSSTGSPRRTGTASATA